MFQTTTALRRSHRRPRWRMLPMLTVLVLAGCDIPTAAPHWETLWVLPGPDLSLGVADIVPAEVGVDEAANLFELNLSPFQFSRSLGEFCLPCIPFNGVIVPKPAFTATFQGGTDFPADLLSAELVSGSVRVTAGHDFDFDPLRPSATARGYLVVEASSGGIVLARDSLDGSTVSFAPGAELIRTLQLSPTTIAGPIEVQVTLHSPHGDPVRIDTSDRVTFLVALQGVRLSEVRIRVTNQQFSSTTAALELNDEGDELLDRVRDSAIRLTMDNPFELSGSLDLRIVGAGLSIQRSIQVQPGTTEARVELSAAELRAILQATEVRLEVSGTVTSPASGILVRPDDRIEITTEYELRVGRREG